jgi:S-adenosylmethionine:tRNA ribosyltransferase-isomerase
MRPVVSDPSLRVDRDPPFDLSEYDYELPPENIAQHALAERDAARLLVIDRAEPDAPAQDRHVRDLASLLAPGDLLVVNATRVLPSRLVGTRESGGAAEALVLGPEGRPEDGCYRALVKISGRLRPGIAIRFIAETAGADGTDVAAVTAQIREVRDGGEVVLEFARGESPYSVGRAPLPPYIRRGNEAGAAEDAADLARYQTVFARVPGAIAAPTAGLHLTEALFEALEERGVERAEVVLHVGAGTFRPLRDEDLRAH